MLDQGCTLVASRLTAALGASRSFERGPNDRPFTATAAVFDLS
jgi:hypothetical protein